MPSTVVGRRTKERILDAAIRLFNAQGVSHVSIRRIAQELGISHGNLDYHYKNKGLILRAIHERMTREMDDAVFPPSPVGLAHFDRLIGRIESFQRAYRFFYLDLVEITRRFPDVARRHRETYERRREEQRDLFRTWVEQGLMRPEIVESVYEDLSHTIWVVITFSLSERWIFSDGPAPPPVRSRLWSLLIPYLTEGGRREYDDLDV